MNFRIDNEIKVDHFLTCARGAVAVITAFALPVLLGFTSLGIEVGHWYLGQRIMQGAADAAAISATAQYIADAIAGNSSSTTYQTVGVSYASLNGYTIPTSNVCLVTSSGNNCSSVLALDSRPIVCASPPCIVVEITQNTAQWLTTKMSLEPSTANLVQSIPGPTIGARAIVSANSQTQTITKEGTDCVLALANDSQAVLVHGNGDLQARCGLAVDGGIDQNVSGTAHGGISFSGSHAKINVSALVVAASSTNCPDSGAHCQQYGSSAALPASAVYTSTATQDPYASMTFPTPPLGVQTGGVAIKTSGAGYTNGTCTFTVNGGTGTSVKFTATITSGKVDTTKPVTVSDPGAYTVFPTNPVTPATSTCGNGTTAATFNLTEGCFTWISGGTPIAGRKYCSINLNGAGTTNFATGSYYIAGGDSGCQGFCVSSANASVTSDSAGVTFYLTNGDGANSLGAGSYATMNITSGAISLCAPGTNCGTTCVSGGSCLLFVQGAPAAVLAQHPVPTLTANPNGTACTTTCNSFAGNGSRTISGLIYIPQQAFQLAGNSSIGGCFGVVAKYIDDGGIPTFSDGCLPGNGIGGTTTTTTTWSIPYLYQ
jgi:Flp pilus assembly protein TadG